jgi:hypothetical protein
MRATRIHAVSETGVELQLGRLRQCYCAVELESGSRCINGMEQLGEGSSIAQDVLRPAICSLPESGTVIEGMDIGLCRPGQAAISHRSVQHHDLYTC